MRVCLIHIGTHKTGTTALQLFLAHNRSLLPAAGVYVPASGVDPWVGVGHHLLSRALTDPAGTTVASLIDELHASNSPIAVVSSEELTSLALRPHALAALADAMKAADYQVKFLVYARPQAQWAESLYGERLKQNRRPPTFAAFIETTLALGGYSDDDATLRIPFDFEKLLEPFAAQFGSNNIIVRAYPGRENPEAIYDSFKSVLGDLYPPFLQSKIRLRVRQMNANESSSFHELLTNAYTACSTARRQRDPESLLGDHSPDVSAALLQKRFALISHAETTALLQRFGPSNERFAQTYGLRLPFITEGDVASPSDETWARAAQMRAAYDALLERWRNA